VWVGGVLRRHVRKALRGLTVGLLLLLAPASTVVGAWAALFSCPFLCLLSTATAFSAVLSVFPVRRRSWLGAGLLGLLVCVGAVTWRVAVQEVDRSIAALAKKIAPPAPNAPTLREKLGIYGLNVAMGLAALPVYPEAARETLWLVVPSASGRRVFRSRFPMRSTRVREVVGAFGARLRSVEGDRVVLESVRVAWPATAYQPFGGPEARVALALNPAKVSAEARRQGARWEMAIRVEVRVEYPPSASVRLMEDPQLRVEEGLFWVLQQARWLHPYTAVWEFEETVAVDTSAARSGIGSTHGEDGPRGPEAIRLR